MMRGVAMMVLGVVLVTGLASAQQDMAGREFEGVDLRGARFVRCDLREARFEQCRLDAAQCLNLTEAAKLSLRTCRLDAGS